MYSLNSVFPTSSSRIVRCRSGTHARMPKIKYRCNDHATLASLRSPPPLNRGATSCSSVFTTLKYSAQLSHFFLISLVGEAFEARRPVSLFSALSCRTNGTFAYGRSASLSSSSKSSPPCVNFAAAMNALRATNSYAALHFLVSESHCRCSNASFAAFFFEEGKATVSDVNFSLGYSSGNSRRIHPSNPRSWSSYFFAVTSLTGASCEPNLLVVRNRLNFTNSAFKESHISSAPRR
mmetsp:Transcript_798/g.2690  ORF Transcript_798/g.2690 Transcript_798/m.2690 type:complete len:236 (-) Transcript_798:66-773(-)